MTDSSGFVCIDVKVGSTVRISTECSSSNSNISYVLQTSNDIAECSSGNCSEVMFVVECLLNLTTGVGTASPTTLAEETTLRTTKPTTAAELTTKETNDQSSTCVLVSVCADDSCLQPMPLHTVEVSGIEHVFYTQEMTDSSGFVCIDVKLGSTVRISTECSSSKSNISYVLQTSTNVVECSSGNCSEVKFVVECPLNLTTDVGTTSPTIAAELTTIETNDQPSTCVLGRVCADDSCLQPVPLQTVEVSGIYHVFYTQEMTDSSGFVCIDVKVGSTVRISTECSSSNSNASYVLQTSNNIAECSSGNCSEVMFVAGCQTCDGFLCGSGECINASVQCDGNSDCNDGSDELDCQLDRGCLIIEACIDKECLTTLPDYQLTIYDYSGLSTVFTNINGSVCVPIYINETTVVSSNCSENIILSTNVTTFTYGMCWENDCAEMRIVVNCTMESTNPTTPAESTALGTTKATTTEEPSTMEKVDQTTAAEPTTMKTNDQTTAAEPTTIKTTYKTTVAEPTTMETTDQTSTAEPTTIKTTDQTTAAEPTTIKTTDQTTAAEPTTIKTTDQTTVAEPTTIKTTYQTTVAEPTTIKTTYQTTVAEPTTIKTTYQTTVAEPTTIKTTDQTTVAEPTTIKTTDQTTVAEPTTIKTTDQTTVAEPTTIKTTDQTTVAEPTTIKTTYQTTVAEPTTMETTQPTTVTTYSITLIILFIGQEEATFSNDLDNPESALYIQYENSICDSLTNVYDSSDIILCKVTRFSQGSIIADIELTFPGNTVTANDLETVLVDSIEDGGLPGTDISVDADAIEVIEYSCPGYCYNRGTCDDSELPPMCTCDSGYEGDRCEDESVNAYSITLIILFVGQEEATFSNDLDNPESALYMQYENSICDSLTNVYDSSDIILCKVTRFSQGSIIADIELTFPGNTVTANDLETVLADSIEDNMLPGTDISVDADAIEVIEYSCPGYCSNRGTCDDSELPPVCTCDSGYEGDMCEDESDTQEFIVVILIIVGGFLIILLLIIVTFLLMMIIYRRTVSQRNHLIKRANKHKPQFGNLENSFSSSSHSDMLAHYRRSVMLGTPTNVGGIESAEFRRPYIVSGSENMHVYDNRRRQDTNDENWLAPYHY
ncbi:uncharacterized protein [Antedon mediterranea]|uniref:uncharacterized protein n=1 Tax=Antedon mediterranea TaxID=105859 RepID=UPI003AF803B1